MAPRLEKSAPRSQVGDLSYEHRERNASSLQRKQRQKQTMQRNRSDPEYRERELQAQRDKRANDFALRDLGQHKLSRGALVGALYSCTSRQ